MRVPEEQILMEDLHAKENLSYQEYPIKILEMSGRVTRNKRNQKCKVQWSHHTEEEANLGERRRVEGRISKFLFRSVRISEMRFILRGVGL
jgi:hypothetical protein